jgi:hypothetical protein
MSSLTFSQKVRVDIDTTNIRIGEQFLFKIVIKDTANVILPEKLEKLTSLEVVKDIKIDTFNNSLIKKYLMTGFDSGAFYIPSQQIFIKNRAFFSDSILINVATIAVDTSKQKIFPIKAIQMEPLIYDDFKPYIIWVVLGLVLIGLIFYYLLNRKKSEDNEDVIINALPPYEEAIKKLKELDNKLLWQNNEVKKYYSELTEIVRGFIEKELKVPALEITTFELVSILSDFKAPKKNNLNKDTIQKLNALLNEADLVKFAKSTPLSHEIEEDRRIAEKVLNDLKPIPLIKETEENELE